MKSLVWMMVLAATCLSLAGCASGKLLGFGKNEDPFATADDPVINVVAMWDPGTGPGIDRRTARGFIGNVMFLTTHQKAPVRVKGALRVYVFDDQGSHDEQVKPLHEFYLNAETVDAHYNHSDLGANYTIFVPYTRKGNHRANCSLRLHFTPMDEKTGKLMHNAVVCSDMATITLKGAEKSPSQIANEETIKTAVSANGSAEKSETKISNIGDETNAPRAPAVPLTDAERERILAEASGKLSEDQSPSNSLTPVDEVTGRGSFDDLHADRTHPLSGGSPNDDADEDREQAPPARRHARSDMSRESSADADELGSHSGHPLDSASVDEEEAEIRATPVRRRHRDNAPPSRLEPASGMDSGDEAPRHILDDVTFVPKSNIPARTAAASEVAREVATVPALRPVVQLASHEVESNSTHAGTVPLAAEPDIAFAATTAGPSDPQAAVVPRESVPDWQAWLRDWTKPQTLLVCGLCLLALIRSLTWLKSSLRSLCGRCLRWVLRSALSTLNLQAVALPAASANSAATPVAAT